MTIRTPGGFFVHEEPESVDLSVVIPAYNEAERIGATLSTVAAYLETRGDSFEILVVDDGSTDATVEVAGGFDDARIRCLESGVNAGKGAAVRQGLTATRGSRVLVTDADLSTPISELEKLEPHLAAAPIVAGSRARDDSDLGHRQPRIREWLGKTFNGLLRLLGLTSLEDTQCGFKLLDGDVARDLAPTLTIDGFAYDVELLYRAQLRGYRVIEVGVRWDHREPSSVPVLGAGSRMVYEAIRLRWASSTAAARGSAAVLLLAGALALALQIVAIDAHSLSGDGSYHLVAGHQALRHGRNTTNLEHPPLAKLVFALPTLLETPIAPPIAVEEVMETRARLHTQPQRLHRVTTRGKYLALAFFGLPLLVFSYVLGRRSGGRRVGILLALTLSLSFSVVGNLTTLQTDVAVALAFVLTVLAADGYVRRPSAGAAVWLGAALGLGLAVKFSGALLGPTALLALALAYRRLRTPARHLARDALLLFAVAIGVLHLAYLAANLDYSGESGRAAISAYTEGRGTAVVDPVLREAKPGLLALERVDPFLAQWFTGFLAVRSHNEVGVYPSYAFGAVSSAGRWWYHPAVLLLKTPLVMIVASLVALGLWVRRRRKRDPGTSSGQWSALTQLSLLTVLVYTGVAVSSNYNLGFRHLLPVLPFLYLPVARRVATSRALAVTIVLLLAVEALAMTPLWSSQTNTWWLKENNPTRFSLSHGNLDYGQNYKLLARVARRRGLGEVGVLDPRLRPQVLAAYFDEARLVHPGDPVPGGWYAVNLFVEQLLPAILRQDVDYLYDLEGARSQALSWRPLWREVLAGEDHGYIAGTFHLYRVPDRQPPQ